MQQIKIKEEKLFICDEYKMLMGNCVITVQLATGNCSTLGTGPPQRR